jgi:RNA polymerase sigma-70 factor (ECF subfamily)
LPTSPKVFLFGPLKNRSFIRCPFGEEVQLALGLLKGGVIVGILQNTCLIGENTVGVAVFTSVKTQSLNLSKESNALDQHAQIVAMYDELRPPLHAYLSSLGLTASEIEDIAQESFVRLVVHLVDKGEEKNIRGWLFRVAHNLSMDIHRDSARDPSITEEDTESIFRAQVDPSPSPEEVFIEEERIKRVNSGIQRLTHQQRQCILLRAEGLRYEEIAMILHITTQRAAYLVQRGLVRLAVICG